MILYRKTNTNFNDFSPSAQENSPENDTFQAGGGKWVSPPSTAKLIGWKMSDHKESLFRSIELISLKLH